MLNPFLQYRPQDRGFLLCMPEAVDPAEWVRALRTLPGELQGRERLTPAKAQLFLADGALVEMHAVPLRWQRAYPWLSSLALRPGNAGPTLRYWAMALRLLQSLVVRGAMLPQLDTKGNPWKARWGVSLTSPSDRSALRQLVEAMPPAAVAFPENDTWAFTKTLGLGELDAFDIEDDLAMPPPADAVLSAFLEDGADFIMRFVSSGLRAGDDPRLGLIHRLRGHKRDRLPWDERINVALSPQPPEFPSVAITERIGREQLAR